MAPKPPSLKPAEGRAWNEAKKELRRELKMDPHNKEMPGIENIT
jgi:hypothetical protein